MPKYLIHGKTSSDFAAAMLNKPQDRYEMLLPFFEKFGIDVKYLFVPLRRNLDFGVPLTSIRRVTPQHKRPRVPYIPDLTR